MPVEHSTPIVGRVAAKDTVCYNRLAKINAAYRTSPIESRVPDKLAVGNRRAAAIVVYCTTVVCDSHVSAENAVGNRWAAVIIADSASVPVASVFGDNVVAPDGPTGATFVRTAKRIAVCDIKAG